MERLRYYPALHLLKALKEQTDLDPRDPAKLHWVSDATGLDANASWHFAFGALHNDTHYQLICQGTEQSGPPYLCIRARHSLTVHTTLDDACGESESERHHLRTQLVELSGRVQDQLLGTDIVRVKQPDLLPFGSLHSHSDTGHRLP